MDSKTSDKVIEFLLETIEQQKSQNNLYFNDLLNKQTELSKKQQEINELRSYRDGCVRDAALRLSKSDNYIAIVHRKDSNIVVRLENDVPNGWAWNILLDNFDLSEVDDAHFIPNDQKESVKLFLLRIKDWLDKNDAIAMFSSQFDGDK